MNQADKKQIEELFADCDVNNLPEYNQHFRKSDIPIYNNEHDEAYDKVMRMVELNDMDHKNINAVNSIQNEREKDYGDAATSMRSIGEFWGTYISRKKGIKIELDEIDVSQMMTLFKINRNAYKRKLDNAVDGAAYADFTLKFESEGD